MRFWRPSHTRVRLDKSSAMLHPYGQLYHSHPANPCIKTQSSQIVRRRDGSVVGKGGWIITSPLSHKSELEGLIKYIDD